MTWPTAFWSLATIAVNSMMAPNGMVLSLPSTWGIALRSSPILCLFDALDITMFWLTLVIFSGEGPRVAAKRVARVRFRDVHDVDGEQSLTSLRKNFWLMQVLFLVLTATQAIKLFACQGIAGTQVCAAFYLYSYLVSEVLIWAAGDDWESVSLEPLEPGPLRVVSTEGLLPWIPSHVLGVIFHCGWVGHLLEDAIDWGPAWLSAEDTVPYIPWAIVIIALGSIMPFVMSNTDSSRSIQLSERQLRFLPFVVDAQFIIRFAWNAMVNMLWPQGPFLYYTYFYNVCSLLDLQLAAFAQASRQAMKGTIPSVQVLVLCLLELHEHYQESGHVVTLLASAMTVAFCHLAYSVLSQSGLTISVTGGGRMHLFTQIVALGPLCAISLPYVAGTASVPREWLVLRLAVMLVYVALAVLGWSLGAEQARFSPSLAGGCFVAMNLSTALLWYWKVWPHYEPECMVKPGWTDIFG